MSIFNAWSDQDSHDIVILETLERFNRLTLPQKRELEFLRSKYGEEFGREFGVDDSPNPVKTQWDWIGTNTWKAIIQKVSLEVLLKT